MYKAILFDYDGTLIDTNKLIIDSWAYMSEKVFGKMVFDEDYLVKYFGTPLEYAVDETRKHYNIEGYTTEELCDIYREYQQVKAVSLGEPFPGIPQALKALKEKGVLLGIVTSRSKDSTISGLKRCGLDILFDAIITAEDTNIHKPLPTPCLLCCEKLGVNPCDAVMVGDARHDIECANNAGAASAFVRWSYCTKIEDLESFGGESIPSYILSTPEDLLKL